MISDVQMIAVGVSQCPGIGRKTLLVLMEKLQERNLSLEVVWKSDKLALIELGLTDRVADQLIAHQRTFSLEKKRKEFEAKNISIVTMLDSGYPELLKHISDHPAVLYVQGILKEMSLPIAVVGTRKITSYGKMVTRMFTKDLVHSGAQIISGFMYGVDTLAHESALEFGGYTVGILGYGFDFNYPDSKTHRELRKKLLEGGGALLSEYDPATAPNPGLFPERNRIVAGLSKGVLVTEAASKSGSKITANLATEYGRDVFAVPGPITSPYSEGTKDLINQGAKLVTRVSDILDEYQIEVKSQDGTVDATALITQLENVVEKNIVEQLLSNQLTSDELCKEIEIDSHALLGSLGMLELKGVISLEKGKYGLVAR